MRGRVKYQVNGELFVTKKEVVRRCQEILYRVPLGDDVTEEDKAFLLALLKHHPRGHGKTRGGVRSIHVYQTDYPSRGFMMRKQDGRPEDFSFMKAIRGLQPESRPVDDQPTDG